MSIEETEQKLPAGWRWAKLGDLCDQDRQMIDSSSDRAKQLPYLSLEHIESQTGRISRDPLEKVEDEGKSTTFLFDSRHVLYGKLRPYLSKVALPEFEGRCTTEAIPLLPRDDTSRLFLAWLLRREETVAAAMAEKTGSRMPRASMDDLLKLEVPIPSLPEQKRIAAILTVKMAAVKKARTVAETRLKAAKELPAAYLREVFESEEAQGWPRKRLGDVLYLRNEIVHPHDKPEGNAMFVGLEHLQSGTGIRSGSVSVEMENLTGRKPRFYKGDIVYGYLRPYLNKVWIAEFDGLCSVDQYVYSVDSERADTRFVAWYMRSPLYLQRAPIDTSPGQLPRIRKEEVASVTIELPPIQEQTRIADQIDSMMKINLSIAESIMAELDAINKLPAAILRRTFAGEL